MLGRGLVSREKGEQFLIAREREEHEIVRGKRELFLV